MVSISFSSADQSTRCSAVFRFCLLWGLATWLWIPCAQPQSPASEAAGPLQAVPLKPHSEPIPAADRGGPPLRVRGRPLHVDVDLVLVPVTVSDAMNRPVMGLERQNFALFEDDVRQQVQFLSTEDAPISVGVILDISKSMSNKIDVAREAVGEFFKYANPQDDYFVVTFSDRPAVLADATQSIGSIQAKLASATPAGHTALLDAIYLGVMKAQAGQHRRRALVIISDGGDNHSRYTTKELKSLVEEEDVQLYAIGIFGPIFKTPEEWSGKRLLTQITEATGGRTITVNNPRELPRAAATISTEMRNQYVLGYLPSNVKHDGKWRKIKVRVTTSTASMPQVHAKSGYLAPAE